MTPDAIDWGTLERLRRAFLEGTAGDVDYWQNPTDLAAYDATFAQRIGWKWDFVLADLNRAGWMPPEGHLLDWGCGSGIAARAFLDHFSNNGIASIHYFDRSPRAVEFAVRRATERFPGTPIHGGAIDSPSVLLLSHVLTELSPPQVDELLNRARTATSVIWVEPGTYEASLALIAVRERLREEFHPVAPCLHSGKCGILSEGNEPHWCHHFADPPSAVFTDPFWGRFANLLNIDLRSVPLSYLVLDRRPPAPPPVGALRMLGRPRLTKSEARLLTCSLPGVREEHVPKRSFPEIWRAAKKDRLKSMQVWTRSDGDVSHIDA